MEPNNQTTDREKIAERLKQARTLAGLSQENAARILMIQRPAISEIEAGRRKVSAEEIIQFADLYKVSSSWLLLTEEPNEMDEGFKMAARELSKMKKEDREKLMAVLNILPPK